MTTRKRFFKVSIFFFKMLHDFSKEYKLIKYNGYAYAQEKMRKTHEKRAKELYNIAITLGGVLIKLCQFISSRRDFFPDAYIRILAPLQDKVPPVNFELIEKILIDEYGDYKKVFKKIKNEPLASASLGQTHEAVLHNGDAVVIKVLKPGIEKIIDTDFAILFYTFKLLGNFKVIDERADFKNVLNEFITVTGDELNFRREVYICKEFSTKLQKFKYLKIPHIYEKFCTKKVIVMEFIDGDKINEKEKWITRNNNPIIISKRILELYIEQILFIGLIHFDPHPGNILILNNNKIGLLDFGMSGEIPNNTKSSMQDAVTAILQKDYRLFVDILDSMGFLKKNVNRYTLLPVVEFFLDKVLSTIKLEREAYHAVDLSPVVDDLVEMLYTFPFNIPANWAFIGKTIGTLAGIIASLNPDFKIYDEIMPYADRFLRTNFDTIAKKTFKTLKSNLIILQNLPTRLNNFIEDIEQGHYKIQVDYSEIHDKIDDVKSFIIKLVSFIISSGAVVSSYVSFIEQKYHYAVLLFIISCLSLIVSLVYRKTSAKNKLKKYFN